ncbi:MAG: 2-dehydropantoate 2-reductase [Nannocystaceae bacterium]|nr:2-dehydropantoate 2-reductase [Nannocystaceae bacterium]
MSSRARTRVGVFGAGAIGAHVGTRLSAAGLPVVLFDRPQRVAAGPPERAVDARGRVYRPGHDLVLTDELEALASVDICLVSVKAASTETVARHLAPILPPGVATVSLQNGLRNPQRLRMHLSPVIAAVVGFNVVVGSEGVTTQTVPGKLYLGEGPTLASQQALEALALALRQSGLPTEIRSDITAVAAGKLLLNLNNGIGGATGLGIGQMLADADARACFSECLLEGRRVLAAAGHSIGRAGPLGARAVAAAMRLPTWIVRATAPVAPSAITSTLADLRRGQPTEIDDLNGEIVALASAHSVPAPCNGVVVDAVHAHERAIAAGSKPTWVSPAKLRERMTKRRLAAGKLAAR